MENTVSFLKDLLEYNQYINDQLIKTFITEKEKISEKSIRLFSHVLNAHTIWNNRIQTVDALPGVWDIQPVQEFTSLNLQYHQQSYSILNQTQLHHIITYTTSKGETFTNRVGDILFHVINHSTYHKAQIATEWKQQGIQPVVSDYIFYKRNHPG